MIQPIQTIYNKVNTSRLLPFLLVGGSSTVIDIGLYTMLVNAYDFNKGIISAGTFFLSSIINFALNNSITFTQSTSDIKKKLISFYIIVLIGILLNYLLVNSLLYIGVNYVLAKIMVTGIIVIYNFLLHSRITFK